jgi:hypothetical protein
MFFSAVLLPQQHTSVVFCAKAFAAQKAFPEPGPLPA